MTSTDNRRKLGWMVMWVPNRRLCVRKIQGIRSSSFSSSLGAVCVSLRRLSIK